MPFLHRLPLQLFTWPLIRGQLIPAALFDAHLSPSTFNYKGAVFVDLRSSPSDVERLILEGQNITVSSLWCAWFSL